MGMPRPTVLSAIVILICSVCLGQGQQEQGAPPEKVNVCQLKNNPAAYNHKRIEVTGFVSHGFEDFNLFDPECSSWPNIWLEYGGTAGSGTKYCCGGGADRTRPEQLVVENIEIPLVHDGLFDNFDKLVQRRPASISHARVVGRFFSGRQTPLRGGYGHMGCCSLLVIEKVISVDAQDRDDLDYSGESSLYPQPSQARCGHGFPQETFVPYAYLIKAQQMADAGERAWSFSDPKRVASDAVARLLNLDEASIAGLAETHRTQGQVVYEWHRRTKDTSYMIVVSRPYLLSLYAADVNKVAWVARATYEFSCRGRKPVG
jgi:hypothetical protein